MPRGYIADVDPAQTSQNGKGGDVPIHRSYTCPECFHRLEVVLSTDQWNAPPPSCPSCDARDMAQEFKPPAIGGSIHSRAVAITEDIMRKDYNVANYTSDGREGGTGKVQYADQTGVTGGSAWAGGMLEQAIQIGRKTRLQDGGSGLDILQRNLRSGVQVDLIEASKKRAIKVY